MRVRNRLAGPSTSSSNSQSSSSSPSTSTFTPSSSSSSSSLNAALHESAPTNSPPITRAVHALGLGRKEPVGPKYFVNIQTDGPVTSDLFQHRLWLGEEEGGEWQTVVVSKREEAPEIYLVFEILESSDSVPLPPPFS